MHKMSHKDALEVFEPLQGAAFVRGYFADMGPHAGKYRVQVEGLYLTQSQIDALNEILSQ
jgi:hypothetical protein